MSPLTHFLSGWLLTFPANPTHLARREKALIVAAAVVPDIDGLGIVPELLTRNSSHPLLWYSQYHHLLHTLAFAIVCIIAAFLVNGPFANVAATRQSTHPWLTASLVFISFHLHLFCDVIGTRGPDGYQWPIPYLKPFSNTVQLTWQGQWALNGWQNIVFTGLLVLSTLWLAWKYGTSPIELFSPSANLTFGQSFGHRFPREQNKVSS